MAERPVEIAAEALHDRRYNDLSGCPYFMRSFGGDPEGICFKGCQTEPECITCQPAEQWTGERIRERYPSVVVEDGVFGEPTTDDCIDAVAALEALHAAGWRLVRTDPACGSTGSTHDYSDPHVAIGFCIIEEWIPAADPAGGTEAGRA